MDISVASSEARLDLDLSPNPSAGGTSGRAWSSLRETGRKIAAHVRLRPGPFSTVYRPFPVANGPFGLLSKLHHEIRTPLNAIIGFSELFLTQRPSTPDQARALVENVHASGQRLLAIVEALLGHGTMPFDAACFEKQPVNLRHAFADVSRVTEPAIRRSGCLCVLLADEDLLVEANPAAFHQMIVKVLSAVSRRASADSLVMISAQRDKANTCIEFRCKDLDGGRLADCPELPVVKALALAQGGRLEIEKDDGSILVAHLTFFATTAVQ